MSKRLTRSSSQDVDSRRPERIIKEKDAEDEDKDEDEDGSDTSDKEEKQHAKARTEDQVNITAILLTIHCMQEKIDLIMMKLGLDDGSEAAVVTPGVKRPKKTLVSRSASSFSEEASHTSSISANDSAMVHML